MMTLDVREAVVEEARSWKRTPFHHRAGIKGVGVDCAHLLVHVYHATTLVPYLNLGKYTQDWMLHRSEERFRGWVTQYANPIAQRDAQMGDICLMKVGRCYSHGAIMLSPGRVIHSYVRHGVIESSLNEYAYPMEFYALKDEYVGG